MSQVYATVNTFVGYRGQSLWIGAGDAYESSHPLVKAHPNWFTKDTSASPPAAQPKGRSGGRSNG